MSLLITHHFPPQFQTLLSFSAAKSQIWTWDRKLRLGLVLHSRTSSPRLESKRPNNSKTSRFLQTWWCQWYFRTRWVFLTQLQREAGHIHPPVWFWWEKAVVWLFNLQHPPPQVTWEVAKQVIGKTHSTSRKRGLRSIQGRRKIVWGLVKVSTLLHCRHLSRRHHSNSKWHSTICQAQISQVTHLRHSATTLKIKTTTLGVMTIRAP